MLAFKPLFTASALALMLAGCASYKDPAEVLQQTQLPASPAALVTADTASADMFSPDAPVQQWWARLQDPALNQLIDRALVYNHSVRIADASLQQARALLRNTRFDRIPTVEAEANGTRQRQGGNPLLQGGNMITESWQAGLDMSWEADLFGRVGSQVDVAAAQALASEADLHAAQVSIAAEVAASYIALRGAQHLLTVAEDNARNQQETFELTQVLAEVGRGDQFDIARAQAQLELTRARIPALEADVNTALNRLAVLSNQAADALKAQLAQRQPLPSLPAVVEVGSPVALLKRRPDIRRAEYALGGAVAGYNVQVADLYPRITFGGGLGYQSSDWGSVAGEQSGSFFAFAPTLRWSAFNMGRVHARIAAADAGIQARVAEFEQSVLRALEETDNALQDFSREEERRLRLLAAVQAGAQAVDFARQRFEIGSSDFISVLDAERTQLDMSAQLAQSETQLLLNLVAVYKALGGGWEISAR